MEILFCHSLCHIGRRSASYQWQ